MTSLYDEMLENPRLTYDNSSNLHHSLNIINFFSSVHVKYFCCWYFISKEVEHVLIINWLPCPGCMNNNPFTKYDYCNCNFTIFNITICSSPCQLHSTIIVLRTWMLSDKNNFPMAWDAYSLLRFLDFTWSHRNIRSTSWHNISHL